MTTRLRRMVDVLRSFERNGFTPGVWLGGDRMDDGAVTWPMFDHGPEVRAFMTLARTEDWVQTTFNWPYWAQSAEAHDLMSNPSGMAGATLDNIERGITVIVRQERFSSGSIKQVIASGLTRRIAERLERFLEAG